MPLRLHPSLKLSSPTFVRLCRQHVVHAPLPHLPPARRGIPPLLLRSLIRDERRVEDFARAATDKDLRSHPSVDNFYSSSTVITVLKIDSTAFPVRCLSVIFFTSGVTNNTVMRDTVTVEGITAVLEGPASLFACVWLLVFCSTIPFPYATALTCLFILVTWFVGSAIAFGCFSCAAIIAKSREYLYLGGMLSSGLSILLWLQFATSIFGHSTSSFMFEVYFDLLIFLGYMVYDTQEIIERTLRGDMDYIKHALTLFTVFIVVLVQILVIVLKNVADKSEDKKKRGHEHFLCT